jgi:hypothetical protein
MVDPGVESLIVTDCAVPNNPPTGLKVGVAAIGVPDVSRATITLTKVSAMLAVAVAV